MAAKYRDRHRASSGSRSFGSMLIIVAALAILGAAGWGAYHWQNQRKKQEGPSLAQNENKSKRPSLPGANSDSKKPTDDSPLKGMRSIPAGLPMRGADADAFVGGLTPAIAVKRIAELAQELVETRPLLIVWLLDQSASNTEARRDVLSSMALTERASKTRVPYDAPPLLSVVGTYAAHLSWLAEEPAEEIAPLATEAAKLISDESGVENTFAAIEQAANKFGPAASTEGRRMLVVLVTDEVGDDGLKAEAAQAALAKSRAPLYVIGVTAPLGAQGAFRAQAEGPQGKVSQGPDSPLPDVLAMNYFDPGSAFWTASGQDPYAYNFDLFPAPWGPFLLSGLCVQTGGEYFAVPVLGGLDLMLSQEGLPNSFDREAMIKYAPESGTMAAYDRVVKSQPALAALHKVAAAPLIDVRVNLRYDFPGKDEQRLKRDLDMAQRPPARVMPKLEAAYDLLKQAEGDRAKLDHPRYQASFDLALGRAAAMRARFESYGAMLALLKQGKAFSKPESTRWVLLPADEISVGSSMDRMRQLAQSSLQRVIKEHPGTPWALMAQRELQVPIGWKWTEQ